MARSFVGRRRKGLELRYGFAVRAMVFDDGCACLGLQDQGDATAR
jgi:hypothetical protein